MRFLVELRVAEFGVLVELRAPEVGPVELRVAEVGCLVELRPR